MTIKLTCMTLHTAAVTNTKNEYILSTYTVDIQLRRPFRLERSS